MPIKIVRGKQEKTIFERENKMKKAIFAIGLVSTLYVGIWASLTIINLFGTVKDSLAIAF
jgi:hypothetical protein